MSDRSKATEQQDDGPQFDYAYHLQLDHLLATLRPITDHPEEHLFVTVHHVLELWFKQIIYDLGRIREMLDEDRLPEAVWLMNRIAEILKLAEAHWPVLETMSAADFAEFRGNLTGASGLQSRQFRQVEVMLGLHEVAGDAYRQRVEAQWPGLIAEHPRTIRAAFFAAFARSGKTLLEVYRDRWRDHDLFRLAEAAFEIDRRFQSWRQNHILMVRREIGIRAKGTGGTFFRDYLATTTGYLFFPELFEFRNDLTEAAGGEVMEDGEGGCPV
jgi:tryptophan 2,3-dioxygenase